MLRELKRWVKKLRAKTKKYDYSVPQPVGTVANIVSSWDYTSTNTIYSSGLVAESSASQKVAVMDTREVKKPVEVVDRIVAKPPHNAWDEHHCPDCGPRPPNV